MVLFLLLVEPPSVPWDTVWEALSKYVIPCKAEKKWPPRWVGLEPQGHKASSVCGPWQDWPVSVHLGISRRLPAEAGPGRPFLQCGRSLQTDAHGPDTMEECLPFWPQQRVQWLQSEALGVRLPLPTQVSAPGAHHFLVPVNTLRCVSRVRSTRWHCGWAELPTCGINALGPARRVPRGLEQGWVLTMSVSPTASGSSTGQAGLGSSRPAPDPGAVPGDSLPAPSTPGQCLWAGCKDESEGWDLAGPGMWWGPFSVIFFSARTLQFGIEREHRAV